MFGVSSMARGFFRSGRAANVGENPSVSTQAKGPQLGGLRLYTAILAALTGRALTTFRAGLALNIISSPLNGLTPFRALVAAFLMTTNLAKPGTTNTPFFFNSW